MPFYAVFELETEPNLERRSMFTVWGAVSPPYATYQEAEASARAELARDPRHEDPTMPLPLLPRRPPGVALGYRIVQASSEHEAWLEIPALRRFFAQLEQGVAPDLCRQIRALTLARLREG